MSGPLPKVAVLFAAGIIAFHLSPYFPVILTSAALAALVLALIRFRSGGVAAYAAVFAAGFLFALVRAPLPPATSPPSDATTIHGCVVSAPDIRADRVSFLADSTEFGRVRVSSTRDCAAGYGDYVTLTGKLRETGGFRNPGLRDFGEEMKREGIFHRVWSEDVEVTGSSASFAAIATGYFFRMRGELAARIERDFASDNALFWKAIILGYGDATAELRAAFSRSGTTHILSVSGSHLAFLAGALFFIFRSAIKKLPPPCYLGMSQRLTATQAALALTIPALVFYTIISGASIPAVRSLAMILVFIAASLFGLARAPLAALSLAALLVLAWHPWAVFNISFQLTFLAVVSLIILPERLGLSRISPAAEDSGGKVVTIKYMREIIVVSMAATVGTAPLAAMYFHQASVIAPLSNLVIVPLAGFLIVPLGLLHCLCEIIADASPLGHVLALASSAFLACVRFFGSFQFASFSFAPQPWWLVLFYAATFIPMRLKPRLAAVACLAVLYAVFAIPPRCFELAMLDVGQGEAAVIRLPGGKHIMIDTGGLSYPDVGESIDVPYLAAHRIGRLDLVILSHAHPDHAGGIAAIARSVPVGEIWRNSEPDRLYGELAGIPVREVGAGFRHSGDGFDVDVIHPSPEFMEKLGHRKADDRKNVSSLVLKLSAAGHSFLFSSDIDAGTERMLVEQYGQALNSDVLKIAHHGSKRSSSPEFLAAVKPDIALISAGKYNPFHHPHDDTIARIQAAGASIYRTDRDGAIVIDELDGLLRVRTYDDFRMRRATRLPDEWNNLRIMLKSG